MDETPITETPAPVPPAAPGAPAPAAGGETPTPGPLAAFGGVVASPTQTFGAMRGAKWHFAVWPLALLAILGALGSFIFMSRVDMEAFTRQQIKRSKFAAQMSAEQMDKAIEGSKDANPYTRAALSVPGVAVWILLVTLIYWVAFLAMGQAFSYGQTLVVVSWAQVPNIIQSALACVVYLVKDPTSLDPMNPILSNPAVFIGQDALPGWLYALLSSADLFSIWLVALYIVGFSAAGKISRGQAATVVIAIFVLKVALKTAWAFFFQA